jgi:dCTP deaminase
MVLSDTEIRKEIESRELLIDPFEEKYLEPASYDLRPGKSAATTESEGNPTIDLEKVGVLILEPYSPAVVSAREHLRLPLHLAGRFGLKSGLSRRGIYASVGPQVDPGFDGWLSVTLFNFTPTRVALDYTESFLSLELNRLGQPASRPYNGDYQGRPEGFTAKEIEPVLGYKGHGLGDAVAGFNEIRQSIGKVAALSDKFGTFLSDYEKQNRELSKFNQSLLKDNQALLAEMKKLVDHIVGERANTVVLRTLSREDAREEILNLFKSTTGPLYYSDIAQRLGIDLEQVLEITSELEREGIIGELGTHGSIKP